MHNHINTSNPINALVATYNLCNYKTSSKDISHNLLSNLTKIPDCTVDELAELCSVSVSTLHRFLKEIGYGSYTEFKLKITDAITTHIYKNQYLAVNSIKPGESTVESLLRQAHENIDKVSSSLDMEKLHSLADALHSYDRIFIHDTMYSSAKLALQGDLALTGKKVVFSIYTEQQKKDLKKMDKACFFLAYYGGTSRFREIEDEIPAVKKTGAYIGVISRTSVFKYKDLCDQFLLFNGSLNVLDLLSDSLIFYIISTVYREKFILSKQ